MPHLTLAAVSSLKSIPTCTFTRDRVAEAGGRAPWVAVTGYAWDTSSWIAIIALFANLTFFPDEAMLATVAHEIGGVVIVSNDGAGVAVIVVDGRTGTTLTAVARTLPCVPVVAFLTTLTPIAWQENPNK
jgi:hypothetical protein